MTPVTRCLAAVFASLALPGCATSSGSSAPGPAPAAWECTMCRAHRADPGSCCGAQARACRYACSCGRHADVETTCCGRPMHPARAARCVACAKPGVAGSACCGARLE